MKRLSAAKYANNNYKSSRPFWLPASSYYILAAAITLAFFFFVWGILQEGGEESPWLVSGIGASVILGGAVYLREIVLRKARNRYLSAQRKLDYNLITISRHFKNDSLVNKLTLQKNAEIIKEIKEKSEAAKILGKLSNGHFEVFEICNEYLSINEKELKTVSVGSPRIAALRRGREIIQDLHRFHLLSWAELECRSLTREAKNKVTLNEKLERAHNAIDVLDSARKFYPNETQLIESEEALKEFIASLKISHWIEEAERAVFKGNYKRAISHYKDALFFMDREYPQNDKNDPMTKKINTEIKKLRKLSGEDNKKIKPKEGNK